MRGYATIIPRNPHLSHAACDDRLVWCVPDAVHRKLADRLAPRYDGDRERAGAALVAWYQTVWAGLPADYVMTADAFKFWQQQFDAAFASAPPVPTSRAASLLAFNCPHVIPCSGRWQCDLQTRLGRPIKVAP
jgi:hypothetical protein